MVRRLITILPAMTLAEALETTRMHRVAGRTGARTACVIMRPLWAPHQTISDVGLSGSRLVKNVTRFSRQQALLSRTSDGQAGDIFYKEA
jgi:predicted ATPase with chaperone activity